MFYLGELFYNVIIMLTKVSLVFLYLRIWSKDSASKAFRVSCWAIIGLLNAIWIAGAFVIIFQCTPIPYTWLKVTGTTTGHCLNIEPFTYAYGALNISTDVLVFVLPIHGLLKLKISWQRKLGLCSVFLVGFLVTICSIVRLQYLVRVAETTNISWDFQYIGMWSLVEANCSVVCCCMPAMAGLIQRWWSRSSEPSYGGSTTVDSEKDIGGETSAKSSGRQTADIESALERWESSPSAHLEEQSARDLLWSRIRRGDTSRSAVLYHRQTPDRPHFVEIAHVPTTEVSTTQLTYRDHNDILHEVSIIDRPRRRTTPPITTNSTNSTTVQRPSFVARSPHTLLPMRKANKKRSFSDAS